jgi:sugar fermentation stimulation protein A
MAGGAQRGCYILVITLQRADVISVGRLGPIDFQAGGYAYVGSALGGLHGRLGRHQRRDKRLHWHIDYLLQRAQLVEMICAQTTERIECQLARFLGRHFEDIAGFGASDCGCRSHLFHAPKSAHISSMAMKAMRSYELVPSRSFCQPKKTLT